MLFFWGGWITESARVGAVLEERQRNVRTLVLVRSFTRIEKTSY